MKRLLSSFTRIVNYKTLIITGLSVVSTYFCFHYGFTAKFPDMLVGVAIVFPVVFSIGSAFSRRGTALQRYSDFKGHAVAIYYATRDWTFDKNSDLPERVRSLIKEMVEMMRVVFNSKNRPEWRTHERKMYGVFLKLSGLTMELRHLGVQSGEISRISQYVSKIIIAFDNMKVIHNYRTPITLR